MSPLPDGLVDPRRCVLEAFLAAERRVEVSIAGQPLHLLTGDLRDRLQLRERAAEEMSRDKEAQIRAAMSQGGGQGEGQDDLIALLLELHDVQQQVAETKLDVLLAADHELIDLAKAQCAYDDDKAMILRTVRGRHEAIVTLVSRLIRDVVSGAPKDDSSWPTDDDAVDLSRIDLQPPTSLLEFAAWLRRRPLVQRLTLCHSGLSPQGCSILRNALEEGLLPRIQVHLLAVCPSAM